jgi:hypothetical protein
MNESVEILEINCLNLPIRLNEVLQDLGIRRVEDLLKAIDSEQLLTSRVTRRDFFYLLKAINTIRMIQNGEVNIQILITHPHKNKHSQSIHVKQDAEQKSKFNKIENLSSIENLELSTRTQNALMRNGIASIDVLLEYFENGHIWNIPNIGNTSYHEIKNALSQYGITAITNNSTGLNNNISVSKDWAELISNFIDTIDDRKLYILISRFGWNPSTLEETSKNLNITRERVRQIEKKVVSNFIRFSQNPESIALTDKIKKTLTQSDLEISIKSFKENLDRSNLLGSLQKNLENKYLMKFDLFESLIAWLKIITDYRYVKNPLQLSFKLSDLLNSNNQSLKSIQVIHGTPREKMRIILREIFFTGGVSLENVMRTIEKSEEITNEFLSLLNFRMITNNWYSLENFEKYKKSKIPIFTASQKMLYLVGEMKIETLLDGIARHTERFNFRLAPPEVVNYTLTKLGFSINDGIIRSTIPYDVKFSRSELSFIDTVRKYGNVVSFFEIVEEFTLKDLSIPAVALLARRYAIVERIEGNLYKIRGTQVSGNQIADCINRQIKFSQNEEVSYGMDGIIRVKANISNYAYISGVMNANRFSELTGEWTLLHNNLTYGTAKIYDQFLYGLSSIFKKINVGVGDKIELAFNTWNRELTIKGLGHE